MPTEVRLIGAFVVGAVVCYLATPVVIRLAERFDFYDRPLGYKRHARPTPYLGGVAVMSGIVGAALAFGPATSDVVPIAAGALVLLALGTLDDRVNLNPFARLAVEGTLGGVLWAAGLSWGVFDSDAANLAISVLWVVGVVNAFNLMDNIDGAAAIVGTIAALGAGVLAAIEGDVMLAALALGVAGSTAAFLPRNLSQPSKIFLGDGGSMPIGFVIAAVVMATPIDGGIGWPAVLAALPMVGLPVLDMALVIVSRRRRREPVLSGHRDHVTHRLLARLSNDPRPVAVVLAVAQAGLCLVGLAMLQLDHEEALAAAGVCLLVGFAAVAVLELPAWAPQRQPET